MTNLLQKNRSPFFGFGSFMVHFVYDSKVSTNSASVRAMTPVAPAVHNSELIEVVDVPAISRCTHGVVFGKFAYKGSTHDCMSSPTR